jgi:alpha-ketoglutarate-dependent 2,4-dichlorophenoxyacetate dioxygenase
MRAAWEALPSDLRSEIEPLCAEHSVFHSRGLAGFTDFTEEDRAAAPPAVQPLVRTNPRTGRKSLYLSAHASHIVGWPVEQGRRLLEELTERATTMENVYSHAWRIGDVVIWDNSTTMHRATAYDEFNHRRVLRRTSVNESQPVVNQHAAR